MSNVIEFKRERWCAGPVECFQCKHEWVGVWPEGLLHLYCPECDGPYGLPLDEQTPAEPEAETIETLKAENFALASGQCTEGGPWGDEGGTPYCKYAKRKPMTEEEILELYNQCEEETSVHSTIFHFDKFARAIEARGIVLRPLNKKQIEKAFEDTGYAKGDSRGACFVAGIRFAEKHHGIGGDDE